MMVSVRYVVDPFTSHMVPDSEFGCHVIYVPQTGLKMILAVVNYSGVDTLLSLRLHRPVQVYRWSSKQLNLRSNVRVSKNQGHSI